MEGGVALEGAISKLTPQDQRELQQFVQKENHKNALQSSMCASFLERLYRFHAIALLSCR
jgi:hypothetical protein